jgi:hypothetical protein
MTLRIWNKSDTLYLADGTPCTPEQVMTKWPFTRNFPVLLEMNGPLVAAIDCLPMIAEMYGIDDALSDEDKLVAIKTVREAAMNPTPAGDGAAIDEVLAILSGEAEV